MPDTETLVRMYGMDYSAIGADEAAVEDPKQPQKLLAVLERRAPGCFVDFGCGSGSLLKEAGVRGWKAVGVEFHADVVRRVSVETGCPVVLGCDGLRACLSAPADIIHLGDVVEHLTMPGAVLRELVGLLAPDGWLVSQGPLEAGPCLFAATLRLARRLRAAPAVDMPPYHVLQVTAGGQLSLFERVGLRALDYVVTEVDWPAPSRLTWESVRQPRLLALFVLRRLSRAASNMSGGRLGNRYFYIGQPAGKRPPSAGPIGLSNAHVNDHG
jgi:SAM-dependent methyltransferase